MDRTEHIEILVVDDERSTAEYLAELLRTQGYTPFIAQNLREAHEALEKNKIAVVLSDLCLDTEQGTELIPFTKALPEPPLVIFITGFGSIDSAVDVIHEGAFDYISKPADLTEIDEDLKNVVERALKHRLAMASRRRKLDLPEVSADARVIVGTSPAMVKIYRSLAKASLTRENILVIGESGTGKELVAHAVHDKSPWRDKPFVTINCCALTETLLESELFGHVRGSFTGATQNKKGLFEEANSGTLFLDEIGDLSQVMQVKLLRAIQEGEIKPVGSSETRKVDVRVVAATHRDLSEYVQQGKFREDLYYRLKVILIEMPPLRERKRDLPDLIQYFIARYVKKTAKYISSVSEETMELLMNYPWPGNIRELENAISRAAAMASSSVLLPEDFPPEIVTPHTPPERLLSVAHAEHPPAIAEANPTTPHAAEPVVPNSGESLEELERRHIAKTLESVSYNKSKAAEILGIDRATLYRKAFKYGILTKASARSHEGQ